MALALLLAPSLAAAQSASGPWAFVHESATESHRGFDEEAPAPGSDANDTIERDDPAVESAAPVADADAETGAKPAGDLPMPVDPAANRADAGRAGATMSTEDGEPGMAAAELQRAPALGYESVLEDYEPYEEADGPGWIEANRRVGEIGGWRTYARELYEASDDTGDER